LLILQAIDLLLKALSIEFCKTIFYHTPFLCSSIKMFPAILINKSSYGVQFSKAFKTKYIKG